MCEKLWQLSRFGCLLVTAGVVQTTTEKAQDAKQKTQNYSWAEHTN